MLYEVITGFLVDVDDLVDVGQPGDLLMFSHTHLGAVQFYRQSRVENLVDQGGFTGPGHTGDSP